MARINISELAEEIRQEEMQVHDIVLRGLRDDGLADSAQLQLQEAIYIRLGDIMRLMAVKG